MDLISISNTAWHQATPSSRALSEDNTHHEIRYLCSQGKLILRNRTHLTDGPSEDIKLTLYVAQRPFKIFLPWKIFISNLNIIVKGK